MPPGEASLFTLARFLRILSCVNDVWSMVQSMIRTAVQAVIEAGVRAAIVRLIAMLNPAGAIWTVLNTLYNAVKWFVANAGRIMSLFQTIVSALQAALSGDSASRVATFVENGLAGFIVPVLDMFARLAGIGDIPGKIRNAFQQIKHTAQQPVRTVLNKGAQKFRDWWNQAKAGTAPEPLVPPDEFTIDTGPGKVWLENDGCTGMMALSAARPIRPEYKDDDTPCSKEVLVALDKAEPDGTVMRNKAQRVQKKAIVADTIGSKNMATGSQQILADKIKLCRPKCGDYIKKHCDPCKQARRIDGDTVMGSGGLYTVSYEAFLAKAKRGQQQGERRVCRVHSIEGPIRKPDVGRSNEGQPEMRELIFGNENQTEMQQTLADKYDAGHLIADSLGGPADVRNLVPMVRRNFNRSYGTWFQMEEYLRKCVNHSCFESGAMTVQTTYDSDAAGIRKYIPTSFTGYVTVCKKSGNPKCLTAKILVGGAPIRNATNRTPPDFVASDELKCEET